jgi:hypothetical protein
MNTRLSQRTRSVLSFAVAVALAAGSSVAAGGALQGGWSEQAKLFNEVGVPGGQFGFGTALHGDTALVSEIDISFFLPGTVHVFKRSGADWTQKGTIVPAERFKGDAFGTALAIDGDTLVVGGVSPGVGRAHVFVLSGDTWIEQAELVPEDGPGGDFYGASVAVDGDTAIVGYLGYDTNRGAAYVFHRSGGVWTQQQQLRPDGETADFFGRAALDGDTALIGAAFANTGTSSPQGDVYVFDRSGTTWTQTTKLAHPVGGSTDLFGQSVALQGDTAVVGASGLDEYTGAVHVYVRTGDAWPLQATLTADDSVAGANFGQPVSVDGDTIVAGAPYATVDFQFQGAAYVFRRSGTAWTQVDRLTASDGAREDIFGWTGVAQDKGTILIGAAYADVGDTIDAGAAYVFVTDDPIFAAGFE